MKKNSHLHIDHSQSKLKVKPSGSCSGDCSHIGVLNREDLIGVLKKHKFRVTPLRLNVLEILSNSKKPLGIEEISARLGKQSFDRVTLYRMMTAFLSQHIVQSFIVGDGAVRYELSLNHGHHHHVVCIRCNDIEHIVDGHSALESKLTSPSFLSSMKLKKFSSLDHHLVEFFGVCKKCRF